MWEETNSTLWEVWFNGGHSVTTYHVCVYAQSLQSCLTLCNPMNCSLPCSSVHGILQARILEWVSMHSSRGSSQSRDRTRICWASGEAHNLPHLLLVTFIFPSGTPVKILTSGFHYSYLFWLFLTSFFPNALWDSCSTLSFVHLFNFVCIHTVF